MNVAERFDNDDYQRLVSQSDAYALVELARPGTPDQARSLALTAAVSGERITQSVVRRLIQGTAEPQPEPQHDLPDPISHNDTPPLVAHCPKCAAWAKWIISHSAVIGWAKAVGLGVARQQGITGTSADDVVGAAVLEATRKAQDFDPTHLPENGDPIGAFEGWAHASVRCAAARECDRLRNGGMYNTTRTPDEAPSVVPLPEGV